MSLAAITKEIKSTYLVVDEGIIKMLMAAVIGHRMGSSPIWLFIVGASGGGKTEMLNSLSRCYGTTFVSSITPNTFISGMKRPDGGDNSLLTKITNGIIIFKDFTTLLSMHFEARSAIMSQMREVYDGKFSKFYGNGPGKTWEGKISVVAGTTDAIHQARELYAAMGERFIMYHLTQPDRKLVTSRAIDNVPEIVERRKKIAEVVAQYLDKEIKWLDENKKPRKVPPLSDSLKAEIINLADFATLARSPVQRDSYSPRREIIFKNEPEMPTRFAEQLTVLASSFMVMNEAEPEGHLELSDLDKRLLFKVALDSISIHRRLVLQKLVHYQEVDTTALAEAMHYPTNTIHRWLEDLAALEIIDIHKAGKGVGRADKWELKQDYRDLLARYEHIEQTTEVLESSETEEEPQLPTMASFEAELASLIPKSKSVELEAQAAALEQDLFSSED